MIELLAGRTVLVTGGSGFLGSHLCVRLKSVGCEVHATSRYRHVSTEGGPVWHVLDPVDLAALRRVLAAVRPFVVFHLAGAVGASPDMKEVLPTFHSLLTSTVNVLIASTEAGCGRIVLTGSLTEPPPHAGSAIPRSPYAAAKWAGSGYGRMFNALYGLPVVIVRPFMAYGPGQHPRKLVPYVASSLLKGEAPRLASGLTRGDWVYVSDVTDAFLLASVAPGIQGLTIDIGTGRLTSIREVVEQIAIAAGTGPRPVFGALPDRPDENEIVADTAATARTLSWTATTSLESGLRQTVEWYRNNPA